MKFSIKKDIDPKIMLNGIKLEDVVTVMKRKNNEIVVFDKSGSSIVCKNEDFIKYFDI